MSGHAKLLQACIAESGVGFKSYSYIAIRESADAYLNLRNAVHSVDTTRVSKLGFFLVGLLVIVVATCTHNHSSRAPAAAAHKQHSC